MKLKDGHVIHMGEEGQHWVAVFDDGKWWKCRGLSIGCTPTSLSSYTAKFLLENDTDVHLHAHVLSYPVPMLAALLNNQ
jgi:hypothetical protein